MEKYIYNEQNGLWYELQGDYYLPCLKLPEEPEVHIGIWGQRHRRYLKSHRRALYTSLLTSGKLNSYLADIDRPADKMFYQLVRQLAEAEGVTEQLKADNQMEWVGRMNNIRNRAMEIVNNELIYAREPAARISTSETLEPPKVFWKYYDLFRRKRISLSEYAAATGLSAFAIRHFLKNVVEKSPKAIEKLKQI